MTDFLLKVEKWLDNLENSSLEDKATYAEFLIKFSDKIITQSLNPFNKQSEETVCLPLYPLAEWLAWNWWRICYEPATEEEQKKSFSWKMSHKMSAVNHGNVWPDITFLSDGRTMNLFAKETHSKVQDKGFAYLNSGNLHLPIKAFEKVAFDFMEKVNQRLREKQIKNTNFQDILEELKEERASEAISQWRTMEARLGCDPDQGDEKEIKKFLQEAKKFGRNAVDEVISGTKESSLLFLESLEDTARISGKSFEVSEKKLKKSALEIYKNWQKQNLAPWKLGQDLAKEVRKSLKLKEEPVQNKFLADITSLHQEIFTENIEDTALPFLFQKGKDQRVVLRAKSTTGRRFELARLLGNDLLFQDKLQVATNAKTWIQQVQRTFSAEFLAPNIEVKQMLAGDHSDENQEKIAEHFQVSPLTINTIIQNNVKNWENEAA